MSDAPLCEAFVAVAELCEALGQHPISKYDGCWECTVDERWKLAVNGHNEPKRSALSTLPIQPFNCFVTFNGWPAFLFNPHGGGGAAGVLANEDTFIAAVRARIESVKAARLDPALAWPFPSGVRRD